MTHSTVHDLYQQMTLPVIAAPMFTITSPELVIAQCASGIIGSLPAMNAKHSNELATWLTYIDDNLTQLKREQPQQNIAPYAVNLIVHASNDRIEKDLEVCAQHKVPLIVTSLRAPDRVVKAVQSWGGKVFHDVTTFRHAEKALEAGVDGLVLVCAGAGGHAGTLSPFALLGEVRRIFDGPVALSGAMSRGQDIAAALAMGADFAYMGTRFIASQEANVTDDYKKMIVDGAAKDILYTPHFTGVPGNYLKPSIVRAGMDPDNLSETDNSQAGMDATDSNVWEKVWGAGQGVGNIDSIQSVRDIVSQLRDDYVKASTTLAERFAKS